MSPVILALLLILSYLLLSAIWQRYKFLKLREELGLKGPPADFFFGNVKDILAYNKQNSVERTPYIFADMAEKYGKTFGYYLGSRFDIISIDIDFAREALVTQFSNFVDRQTISISDGFPLGDSLLQVGHKGAFGNGWKEIRSIVSPSFTSGKMKKMHLLIHNRVETFLEILAERVGHGSFDCYNEWQGLTLDVIAKCAFAMDSNCQRDHNEPFLIHSQTFFREFAFDKSIAMMLSAVFPPIGSYIRPYTKFGRAEKPIIDGLREIIRKRRQTFDSFEGVDLIQLMLQHYRERQTNEKQAPLADETIVSNMYAMLLAGYETTSTSLAYTTHLLAAHQHVQDRLYDEIIDAFGEDGKVDYERVMSIPYLDAIFHESLRLMPPVISFTSRTCIKDTVVNGQRVPAGATVTVPVHAIHWSEEYWSKPKEFNPDRFLSDPSAKKLPQWLPFGLGPRHCVGKRFAEMEIKTAMAEAIRRYRFTLPPYADPELKTLLSTVLLRPVNGVHVEVERRS